MFDDIGVAFCADGGVVVEVGPGTVPSVAFGRGVVNWFEVTVQRGLRIQQKIRDIKLCNRWKMSFGGLNTRGIQPSLKLSVTFATNCGHIAL